MKCNVGGADKALRIIIGIAALAAAIFADLAIGWRVAAYAVGGIALITAFVGYCPLNQIIGLNTCRKE
jgi:hypothetical protein